MTPEPTRTTQPHHRGQPPRPRSPAATTHPATSLPSERVLAAEFHSARNTAREAISILSSEGLVDVQHGRGAFVRTAAAA